MFSLEKIFAGFIDQLSQQHSHEVRLIDLHSRRIQRSLRLIDAAQGDCWTAPCSPVVPTFAEKASRQPGDLVTQDAYQARVHSWRNPLTIVSEFTPSNTIGENTQDHINIDSVFGRGLSSSASPQQDIAGSLNSLNAVLPSRHSSSPLSSPQSLSSALSPLPSSPSTVSAPNDVSQDSSTLALCLPQLGPDKVTGQYADLHDHSDSVREAGGPFDPRHTASDTPSNSSLAGDHHSVPLLLSAEIPLCEKLRETLPWTKKRLRPNPGAVRTQKDHPAEADNNTTKTKRGTKRKATTLQDPGLVADRTSPGPLVALVNQIGQTNTIAEIQDTVQKLKTKPHHVRNLAECLCSRTPIQIDTPPAQIIQATPDLAREIESSIFNEQLSRICNRIALADFYCAYRAAQAKPYAFLQELDRNPSQHSHRSRARNRTKRAEVKDRFIDLVFCESTCERDRKKDSIRVNNWQKAGRPWFELIHRFGTGILLLVPEEVTNCRLRDMKNSNFTSFLNLVEEREPVFRETLAVANGIVEAGFLDHVSYAETATSHPQNLLSSPPSGLNISGDTESILPGHEDGLRVADACSGPDLDALLAYSFRQAAEDQAPKGILDQYYLWQSTRFKDPEGVDEIMSWFPRFQQSQRPLCRYQMLPFFNAERWQLAIFDLVGNIVVCYDTIWTSGSSNSTFTSLQQWFDVTLGNAQRILFDCYHQKDTPVANTTEDTIILTWWFMRQLVSGNDVKSCSIDWRMEIQLADRILSDQRETTIRTMLTSAEELVSPSIHSGKGRDSEIDDP